MTFDPDKFIAQRQQPTFDPDAFIASRAENLEPVSESNRGGGRMANARRLSQERSRIKSLRSQADSGQVTSKDLTPKDMDAIQSSRVADIPELTGSFQELSKNLEFTDALAAMTAFDPDEFGQILQASDPDIGIVTTPEGERLAVNRRTNDMFSINKQGPSLVDAIQFGGAAAMFAPASRIAGVTGQALGGMATQAGIELLQSEKGGEFNTEDVVMAGAAPVAMSKIADGAKALKSKFSSESQLVNDYLKESLAKRLAKQPEEPLTAKLFKEGAKKSTIRQALKEGTVEGVGYKVSPRGGVVADPLERKLVTSGIDERVIGRAKNMSTGDKEAAGKMVEKAEAFILGKANSERDRPQQVIGDLAMKRFNFLSGKQIEASRKIGKAVENDLRDKPVSIAAELDEFVDKLSDLGVEALEDNLNFRNSLIRGSNTTPLRNVYQAAKSEYSSARDLHRLKQMITKQINYDSPAKSPLDSEAENALQSLRAGINEKLRAMSKDYADANDSFSSIAEVLRPFAKDMGKRFDPTDSRVENFVGQELRKTVTNYAKSNDLINGIDDLARLSKELGANFDEDIMTHVMLNVELEKAFGTFAAGSHQGVVERGAGFALDEAGIGGRALKAGINEAKKLRFTPPSKEKLELIGELKKLVAR